MNLFGTVINGLGTALNMHESRHRVVAENIANAETPGYRARRLDFEARLQEAFDPRAGDSATAESALPVEPEVDRTARLKADRNSVDLDTEMARMSENTLRTVALSRLLARKYQGLKTAIAGTR